MVADFASKFRLRELTVFETDFWTVSVRPEQTTLGSLVISSRRPDAQFVSLTPQESLEFPALIEIAIRAIDYLFSPNVVNLLGLMLVDPRLHLHLIPRYSEVRQFGGRTWFDPDFPRMLRSLSTAVNVTEEDELLLLKEKFESTIKDQDILLSNGSK